MRFTTVWKKDTIITYNKKAKFGGMNMFVQNVNCQKLEIYTCSVNVSLNKHLGA